jgi:hypothetical protein
METLFLVKVEGSITHYGTDGEKNYCKYHLVKAQNKDEAYEKTIKFYLDKTEQYEVYYNYPSVEVLETIE